MYITEVELRKAYDQADETKRLINGLIAYLRKNKQNTAGKISEEQVEYFVGDEGNLFDLIDDTTDYDPSGNH